MSVLTQLIREREHGAERRIHIDHLVKTIEYVTVTIVGLVAFVFRHDIAELLKEFLSIS